MSILIDKNGFCSSRTVTSVTVTELVGWEHLMKNELIIATKRGNPRKNDRERAEAILREFNIEELAPGFTY